MPDIIFELRETEVFSNIQLNIIRGAMCVSSFHETTQERFRVFCKKV